jgi:riboflavin synthase
LLKGLVPGASVAVNGVCLTVTRIDHPSVYFDVMMESLRVTNLGGLEVGDRVNVERAARLDAEIGGHLLSGHVHAVAEVMAVESPENNRIIHFRVPPDLMQYIFHKGYVGLNGASLTVGQVQPDSFNVYLIPETLKVTTFGQIQPGDLVNLEVDSTTQAVVDTLQRMVSSGALHDLLGKIR